jgi:hypothetical protein
VRGFKQRQGIDFDQTFSPVVKPSTIRTVLHLAAFHGWPINQLDVKSVFLDDELAEQVYCLQPAGFINTDRPNHVCRLSKSLYGLKQAPRAWYQRFSGELRSIEFTLTNSDTSLFVYKNDTDIAYLLLYVEYIVLTTSSTALLQRVTRHLGTAFAMKDLGPLHFFLGIHVQRTSSGFFLHQAKYAKDILDRASMTNCSPSLTPVNTKPKSSPASDASFYRSITDALQYLTLTRSDIAYTVHQVCLHMHAPHDSHRALVKRILRYIRGTTRHGIHLVGSSTSSADEARGD